MDDMMTHYDERSVDWLLVIIHHHGGGGEYLGGAMARMAYHHLRPQALSFPSKPIATIVMVVPSLPLTPPSSHPYNSL